MPLEIRPISHDQLEPLALFLISERNLKEDTRSCAARLKWLLWENPHRERDTPTGWVLADHDRVVGSLLVVPQRFVVCGKDTTFLYSSAFFVNPQAGPLGGLLFREFLNLARNYVLFSTSVNRAAGRLWEGSGRAKSIAGSDREYVRILRFSPVLEEWIAKRVSRFTGVRIPRILDTLPFRKLIPSAPTNDISLETTSGDFSDVEAFWRRNVNENSISGHRDRNFLQWRYRNCPSQDAELLVAKKAGEPVAYVGLNRRKRGTHQQINAVGLVDFLFSSDSSDVTPVFKTVFRKLQNNCDLVFVQKPPFSLESYLSKGRLIRREYGFNTAWYVDQNEVIPRTGQWSLFGADGDSAM